MNRRTALASIGAGTTGVLAGCLSAVTGDEDPVRLCRMAIANGTDTGVDVEARLTEDQTVLLEQSARLGVSDPGDSTSFGDTLPTESGYYRVQMRVTGQPWQASYLPKHDVDRLNILGMVESDSEDSRYVQLYVEDVSDGC